MVGGIAGIIYYMNEDTKMKQSEFSLREVGRSYANWNRRMKGKGEQKELPPDRTVQETRDNRQRRHFL